MAAKVAEAQAIEAELGQLTAKYNLHGFVAFFCKSIGDHGEKDMYASMAKIGCRACALKSVSFGLKVMPADEREMISGAEDLFDGVEVIHAPSTRGTMH
jgi:hypothetical protein